MATAQIRPTAAEKTSGQRMAYRVIYSQSTPRTVMVESSRSECIAAVRL